MVVGLAIQGPDLLNGLNTVFDPCKHANGTDIDRSAQFMCPSDSRLAAPLRESVTRIAQKVGDLVPGQKSEIINIVEDLELDKHARPLSVTPNQVAVSIITAINESEVGYVDSESVARIVATELSFIPVRHQHHRADTGQAENYDHQNPLTWKPYQILRKEQPLPRQILAGVGVRGRDYNNVVPRHALVQSKPPINPSRADENSGLKNVIGFIIVFYLMHMVYGLLFGGGVLAYRRFNR